MIDRFGDRRVVSKARITHVATLLTVVFGVVFYTATTAFWCLSLSSRSWLTLLGLAILLGIGVSVIIIYGLILPRRINQKSESKKGEEQ